MGGGIDMDSTPPLSSRGLRYKLILIYSMMFLVPILYMSYTIMVLLKQFRISPEPTSPAIFAVGMGIVAGLAMSIAALILMYRVIRPLREATREAESFFKEAKGDEVQKISHYIIAMTEELRDRVDEVDTYARQLDEAHKRAVQLSLKDSLTGLYNRDHVERRLQIEIERAREFNRSVGVLLVDVDDFGAYNEDYGHILGDKALKEVATIVSEHCRSIDIAGRYTDEQFLIVLPEAGQTKSAKVADTLREAIASHKFPSLAAGKPAHLTVSIGISGFPKQRGTYDSIIGAAQENLKHAKDAGKNRIYPPATDTTIVPSKF
jgi:diguanylate cyclase (GGDEF)-like protein